VGRSAPAAGRLEAHIRWEKEGAVDRPKVVAAIVIGIIVLVLGTMVVIGLIQGDEVDREENPVNGSALAAPLLR
jgi:fumarate reductase subunit D